MDFQRQFKVNILSGSIFENLYGTWFGDHKMDIYCDDCCKPLDVIMPEAVHCSGLPKNGDLVSQLILKRKGIAFLSKVFPEDFSIEPSFSESQLQSVSVWSSMLFSMGSNWMKSGHVEGSANLYVIV